jgi:site-specific recombinase XerD
MNPKKRKKMDIIPASKSGKPTLETLSLVPESAVWLANFVSRRTRLTYHRAIRDFVSFSGMKSENDWNKINQAHVIAWRQTMAKQNASSRTINTNLSALSSLFKHLCEHQAATKNPVTGIQRSKVNNDRVQTPVITPQQVRKMLEAPDSPAVKPQSLLKKLRDKALLSTLLLKC